MTDDETTEATEPADETRLDRLEDKQEEQGQILARIEQALAKIIPTSHAEAEQRTEQRLDRGSSIAEAVRAELDKAKRDEAAQQDADQEKTERQELRDLAAKLREKPPTPPRNPLKAFATLGWGGSER